MKSTIDIHSDRDLVVVSATDDGYAMPLAVTIRSALDHLDPDRRIHLYVLDGGLSDPNKIRLLWSWNDPRLTVQWIRPDMSLVRDLMVSDQVNVVTYLRILMPHVLPKHVKRVIYLDADMLVRRDLAELWDEPQDGHAVLAAQDLAAPWIDAEVSLPNIENCRRQLAAITPVVNYRELGIPSAAPYLNGGLLVADLAMWRREKATERMLNILRNYRQQILWWDQYALNIVFARNWRAIDSRWNQGAHLYTYPDWQHSPFDQNAYLRLLNDPWIVHFCSPSKPWHYFCQHPYTRQFRHCLARTDWKDWRPQRPDHYITKLWDHYYQPLRSQWKDQTRALKRTIFPNRRKAA